MNIVDVAIPMAGGVRWHRDGHQLLISSHPGRVSLWSAEAQLSKHPLPAPTRIQETWSHLIDR
jgi:hypothetical protein